MSGYTKIGAEGEKKDKGDKKEKKSNKFPSTFQIKVKKNTLEAAVAACFRLEEAKKMRQEGNPHTVIGCVVAVFTHLLTMMVQGFLLFVFKNTTASAAAARFSPAAVNAQALSLQRMIAANRHLPVEYRHTLGPIQAKQCLLQSAHPWLGYLMMFVWFCMMVEEFFHAMELIKIVVTLPTVKPKSEKEKDPMKKPKPIPNQSHLVMGKDKDKIDHFQFQWKIFLLFFLLVPQAALSIFIANVGKDFLASTGHPGRLILKAMALKFILSFSKLFYLAYTTDLWSRYLKKAKYSMKRPEDTRNYWNSWIMTVAKVGIIVLLTMWAWSDYAHLLRLREACRVFNKEFGSECLGGEECGFGTVNKLLGR